MKKALVLGGGGSVGIAWETGVVAGLAEGGIDVREVDLVVGTSAGSVVGAQLAHGRDPRDMFRALGEAPQRPLGEGVGPRDATQAAAIFQLWASFERMTEERCAQIGRLALAASTTPEDEWVAAFAQNAPPDWPEKPYLATAVDCESGAFRTFDAQQGVPIARAIAASCAVPGLFAPVTIDGRRYTDGGVRSFTSADVAQRIEPDLVLIVAVFGHLDRGVHALAARQLAQEMGELEAAGATVRAIRFDEAAIEAAGPNMMDPSRRLPAAEAGEAQGRALAAQWHGWWSGRER